MTEETEVQSLGRTVQEVADDLRGADLSEAALLARTKKAVSLNAVLALVPPLAAAYAAKLPNPQAGDGGSVAGRQRRAALDAAVEDARYLAKKVLGE